MSENSRNIPWFLEVKDNDEEYLHNFESDSVLIITEDSTGMDFLYTIEEETEDDIEDIRADPEDDGDTGALRIDDEIRDGFIYKTELVKLRSHSRSSTEKSDMSIRNYVYEVRSTEVVVETDQLTDDQTSEVSKNTVVDHEINEIDVIRDIVEALNLRNDDSIHVPADAEQETLEDISYATCLNVKRSFSSSDKEVVIQKQRKRDRDTTDTELNVDCSAPKHTKNIIETWISSTTKSVDAKLPI